MSQRHCFKTVFSAWSWLLIPAAAAVLGAQGAAAQEKKDQTAKPVNKGTVLLGKKTVQVGHGVAYYTKFFDDMVPVVLMTEKAIPDKFLERLKESLKKGRAEGVFWFDLRMPYVKMTLFAKSPPSVEINLGDRPINTNVGFKTDVTFADGRARGRVFTPKREEAFGDAYHLDVTFDVPMLQVAVAGAEPKTTPPKATTKTSPPKKTIAPRDPGQPSITAEKEMRLEGKLAKDSPPVLGKPAQIHVVKLSPDKTYIIDLESTEFDAYLRILNSAGKELARDDDSGDKRNARLRFTPPKDDNYQIVATRFGSGQGNYLLGIRVWVEDQSQAKVHDVRDGGLKIDGALTGDDKKDRVRTRSFAKTFQVRLAKDRAYTIDMESKAFDAYLRLEDNNGKQLASDDDSGGDLNARIIFQAPEDGVYRIIATSLSGGTGGFTMRVSEK